MCIRDSSRGIQVRKALKAPSDLQDPKGSKGLKVFPALRVQPDQPGVWGRKAQRVRPVLSVLWAVPVSYTHLDVYKRQQKIQKVKQKFSNSSSN